MAEEMREAYHQAIGEQVTCSSDYSDKLLADRSIWCTCNPMCVRQEVVRERWLYDNMHTLYKYNGNYIKCH